MAKIAGSAGLSGKQVYDIILAPAALTAPSASPAAPGTHVEGSGRATGGPGSKKLAQFCADEGISVAAALARLTAKGFKADEKPTLREIAVNNGFPKPYELIDVIRGQPAR